MESRLCTVPFLRISTASCAYKAATLSACPALNSCTQVSRIFCMTAAKSSGSSVACFVEDLVGDWDCVTAAEGSSNNTIKTVNAVLRGSSINPSYDAQMRSNPRSIVTQTSQPWGRQLGRIHSQGGESVYRAKDLPRSQ